MSSVFLESYNSRAFISRESGAKNNPAFVQESARCDGKRMIVWSPGKNGHIDKSSEFHILLNRALNGQRYGDEIFRRFVVRSN